MVSVNNVSSSCFIVVPQLTVEISSSQSGEYLAGMPAQLRCSINFNSAVDTSVAVEVVWHNNGMYLNETIRRRSLQPMLMGTNRYDAILQFDTLSSISDSGNCVCTVTLYPIEAMSYITNATGVGMYMFSVTGK